MTKAKPTGTPTVGRGIQATTGLTPGQQALIKALAASGPGPQDRSLIAHSAELSDEVLFAAAAKLDATAAAGDGLRAVFGKTRKPPDPARLAKLQAIAAAANRAARRDRELLTPGRIAAFEDILRRGFDALSSTYMAQLDDTEAEHLSTAMGAFAMKTLINVELDVRTREFVSAALASRIVETLAAKEPAAFAGFFAGRAVKRAELVRHDQRFPLIKRRIAAFMGLVQLALGLTAGPLAEEVEYLCPRLCEALTVCESRPLIEFLAADQPPKVVAQLNVAVPVWGEAARKQMAAYRAQASS